MAMSRYRSSDNKRNIDYEAAGMLVSVSLDGFSDESTGMLIKELECFAPRVKRQFDLVLSVNALKQPYDGEMISCVHEKQEIVFSKQGEGINIKSAGISGRWEDGSVFQAWYLVPDTAWGAKSAVLSSLVYLGLMRDRLFIHAASAQIDGNGYVFMGQSGSGKTTVAKDLSSRSVMVLGEEIACIGDIQSGRVVLYQVPFGWNQFKKLESITSRVDLKCLFQLDRKQDRGVLLLDRSRATTLLLQNIIGIIPEGCVFLKMLELAESVVRIIGVRTLSYNIETESIIEVIGNDNSL